MAEQRQRLIGNRWTLLADFAVAAMAVSVILEVASYALAGAAGQLAQSGATQLPWSASMRRAAGSTA